MRTVPKHYFTSLALLLAVFASAVCQAAPDWVTTETKSYMASHPAAAEAVASGKSSELDVNALVHIVVSLRLRNKSKLDAALDGNSPGAQAGSQFDAHYEPTEQDANAVVSYLKGCGFSHVDVAQNRLLVVADGNARAVERAFHTKLVQFVQSGKKVFANTSDAMVPAGLGSIILAVEGLQNADRSHVLTRKPVKVEPPPATSFNLIDATSHVSRSSA